MYLSSTLIRTTKTSGITVARVPLVVWPVLCLPVGAGLGT